MSAPYFYQLIGHVFAASHTADHHDDVASALKSAGFGPDKVKQGLSLTKRGEELLDRKLMESPDNKTLEHNMHAAVGEVEMWLQTVKLKMRKAGFDDERINLAVGKDLHAHDHTVSVVGQALRSVAVLRTLHKEEIEKLGDESAVRDLLKRGNTLVKKLYKVADDFVAPSSMMSSDAPIFKDIDDLMREMSALILDLDKAGESMFGDSQKMGLTGYLPYGMGLPSGGNAFNVVLHERAILDAPNPDDAKPTSGWSVGRQGNRENLGGGWTQDKTGSVMGD